MAAGTSTATTRRSRKTMRPRRRYSTTITGTITTMITATATATRMVKDTTTRTITITRAAMTTGMRMTTAMHTGTATRIVPATDHSLDRGMSQLPQLISLLHLASPALPIGGFSYSQGLEAAIDCGLVHDGASAERWISDNLVHVQAQCEAPVWLLLHRAWRARDIAVLREWNDWFHATRETAELRLETEQMGWSLARLIAQMTWGDEALRDALAQLSQDAPVCLPTAFAAACVALGIDAREGLAAYAFNWAENQVAAAIKAVPLGQVAGQHILRALHAPVAALVDEAMHRAAAEPPRLSTFSPLLGLLSSRHETQYSRLFRS